MDTIQTAAENKNILDQTQLIKVETCPICGGEGKVLLRMPTINPKSKDEVELRQCLFCRHWWHNPLPKQKYLSQLYSGDSEFVVSLKLLPKLTQQPEADLARFAKPILKVFEKKDQLNFLEVGSGSGYLLEYFSRFFKSSYGVEPSRLEDKPNVVADIDDLPENVKFDCVIIQDVLEHISNPIEMLKKIKKICNPGAVVYAGFPRGDSYKARLMKNKWSMVRPIGHLHYFSARSIEIMFKKAGWEIVKKRPARLGDMNAREILNWFPLKEKKLVYRMFKSLILGQLLLGKDQWKVIAKA